MNGWSGGLGICARQLEQARKGRGGPGSGCHDGRVLLVQLHLQRGSEGGLGASEGDLGCGWGKLHVAGQQRGRYLIPSAGGAGCIE